MTVSFNCGDLSVHGDDPGQPVSNLMGRSLAGELGRPNPFIEIRSLNPYLVHGIVHAGNSGFRVFEISERPGYIVPSVRNEFDWIDLDLDGEAHGEEEEDAAQRSRTAGKNRRRSIGEEDGDRKLFRELRSLK